MMWFTALMSPGDVAANVMVVVPTVLSVNCIPGEVTGLPSSRTDVPFCVRAMVLAFCVCQLTVTVPPDCTVVGVTAMLAVGLGGVGFGVGFGFGFGPGFGLDGVGAAGLPPPLLLLPLLLLPTKPIQPAITIAARSKTVEAKRRQIRKPDIRALNVIDMV